PDPRRRRLVSPALDVERLQPVGLRDRLEPLADDGLQVLLVYFLLLVGQPLEPLECPVELLLGRLEAELLQPLPEGVPAGELAHDQRALAESDRLGPHDLVCRLLLEKKKPTHSQRPQRQNTA